MNALLPPLFITLAGLALVLVLLNLWQSLRAVLGGDGVRATSRGPGVEERDALLAEKQELLTAIRDIRFEHELGKISEGDYRRLDQRYRARAREVLKALEEQIAPYRGRAAELLGGPAAAEGEATSPGAGAHADAAETSADAAETSADPAVSETAGGGDGRPACPACGTLNEADANFCKKCAAALAKKQAGPEPASESAES